MIEKSTWACMCRELFFEKKTFVRCKKPYIPIIPKTLGEHIMNRRKILGLYQRDAALLIGVTEEAFSRWENSKNEPHISLFPRIITFLQYEWWQFDTNTLSGKIHDYRFRNGLTSYRFGLLLNVHGTTVRGWEEKGRIPLEHLMKKLNTLLENTQPLD